MTGGLLAWLQPRLESWVGDGGLIDAIIVITLLELAVLLAYHHQTKRGLAPRDYLLNVLSGLSLMMALRCTVAGSVWYVTALFLMAAGLAHVTDIALRLQQRTQASPIKLLS